jgi:hypothetical protein
MARDDRCQCDALSRSQAISTVWTPMTNSIRKGNNFDVSTTEISPLILQSRGFTSRLQDACDCSLRYISQRGIRVLRHREDLISGE